MSQVTLADSIRNIPPITRFFTICTVAVCLLDALNIVGPSDLFCSYSIFESYFRATKIIVTSDIPTIVQKITAVATSVLQCYRFLVCFLLPAGVAQAQPFSAILDIYFFYTFANHVEGGKFKGSFPDCLWYTLICGTSIVITTLIYGFFDPSHLSLHHQMMLSCITYTWTRSSKNSIINFLGLVPIKAYYLPLFNLFFKLIVEGYPSLLDTFIGIVGGYLYQCIQSDTLPIYNLFPQFYPQFYSREESSRNRVGTRRNDVQSTIPDDHIPDSIFDKGYLVAPKWLYRLLNFPVVNAGIKQTAFTNKRVVSEEKSSATSTGWFTVGGAFQGKGHRLGD